MPYTIDDYKNQLGYGARLNLFEVDIQFPPALINPNISDTLKIMCERVTFPGSRPITPIDIPFQGDYIRVAGEKAAEGDLVIAFKNPENFKARNQFELWTELIHEDVSGLRTTPTLHKSPWFFINILNHAKEPIRRVEIKGAWPQSVNPLELDMAGTEISLTEVTFAIDNHIITVL